METSTSIAVKPNVRIVQEAFENFLKGNVTAIADVCAEDVVWEHYKVPDLPFSGYFMEKKEC